MGHFFGVFLTVIYIFCSFSRLKEEFIVNIKSENFSCFQQNIISKNIGYLQENLKKMSTGKRINSASNDSAGLQINTRFTSQINGVSKTIQNIEDGISLLETADGTLSEVQVNLQRVRELAIQGQNGTYSQAQRKSIDNEMKALVETINGLTKNSYFNNKPVLSEGDGTTVSGDSIADQRVKIEGIPVNTAAGAKTTVEFWMKWDGVIGTSKPFGWDSLYDLGFQGTITPAFGFNTGNTNILGIESSEMENNWVHVAAVFINGLPNSNNVELYINGQRQTLAEMSPENPTTTSRKVSSTVYIGGWGYDNKYDFGGNIDELKIWDGARTQEEIQDGMSTSITGNEENLLGYWKFDDLTLKDETKYGNNGQFINGASLGEGVSKTVTIHNGDAYNSTDNLSLFAVSDQTLNLIDISLDDPLLLLKLDTALNSISKQRSYLGAKLNQYSFELSEQNNTLIRHQEAKGRVEDVDVVEAMSNMTKAQLRIDVSQRVLSMCWKYEEQKMKMLTS